MAEKLKDILFPLHKVQLFGTILKDVYPEFQSDDFVATVCDKDWPERELKEKMRHTTLSLHRFLPKDFKTTVDILVDIVPKSYRFRSHCTTRLH